MKERKKLFNNKIFSILFIFATIFMGIGYASINSVTLDIGGKLVAKEQDGVYIKSVKYDKDNNANLELSKINSYSQTMLNSTIVLSDTDMSSSITYYITIYNNSNKKYYFKNTLFSDEFYDNNNIEFSLDNLKTGDLINPHSELSFSIVFKYSSNISEITNNILNCYLNFKFVEPANMKSISNGYSGEFWGYKSSIKNIVFQNEINDIDGAVSFDVSEEGNGTVMSRLVSNSDDTYTLYLQSDSIISAPINSSYLFSGFTILQNIENINYLETSKVTNMNNMFSFNNNLVSLDLTNFNTENVKDMSWMFVDNKKIINLDFSKFVTNKVTSMDSMFYGCESLTSLDLTSFNTENVISMNMMFYRCSNLIELNISNFDTRNVKAMGNMFGAMVSITDLDLSNFNTSNVTDMNFMFAACLKLKNLNITSFNTSKVTNMSYMFFSCQHLETIDLSSFDMSNVTSTGSMFNDTGSVKNAYAKTQADADILNNISGKPTTYSFVVRN